MAKKKQNKPRVHKEMKGLELTIDEFGEIKMNKTNEEINNFLDKHVIDKKLKNDKKTQKD